MVDVKFQGGRLWKANGEVMDAGVPRGITRGTERGKAFQRLCQDKLDGQISSLFKHKQIHEQKFKQ